MSQNILFFFGEARYALTHRMGLLTHLMAKGHRPTVVCAPGEGVASLRNRGISVEPLAPFHRSGLSPLGLIWSLFALRKVIQKIRPSLIHGVAMKPCLVSLLAVMTIPKSWRPRVVITFGGMGFLFMSKQCWVRWIRGLFLLVLRFLFPLTKAHLIVQNHHDLQLAKDHGLVDPSRLHLIQGSGVCPKSFPLTPLPPMDPREGLRFAYVGRLLWDKGLGELVQAMEHLKEWKIKASCHIHGALDPCNPTSLTEKDLKFWQEKGLIHWHGSTDDPYHAYGHAHVVVLPSYREGLPKALLEAGMVGRPMIATDVPGCQSVVIHGFTGLLVPAKDGRALAQAMAELIQHPLLCKDLAEKAHMHVTKNFSDAIIQKQHLDLYAAL